MNIGLLPRKEAGSFPFHHQGVYLLIGSKNDSYFEHVDAPLPKVSNINKFRFVGSFLEVNPSISSLPKKSGHGEEDRSDQRSDQDKHRTDLDDNRLTKMMHVRTERGKKARGGKSKLHGVIFGQEKLKKLRRIMDEI